MEIERLALDEGLRLRTIRLRALADAPDAFGSTYAEVAARPLESSPLRIVLSERQGRLQAIQIPARRALRPVSDWAPSQSAGCLTAVRRA